MFPGRRNPTEIKYGIDDLGTSLNLVKATGARKSPAARIRKDPTSPGVRITRPFLINMNELPQISESIINSSQARRTGLSFNQGIDYADSEAAN